MDRNDVMICVHVAGSSSHCVQNLQVLDLLRVGKKSANKKGGCLPVMPVMLDNTSKLQWNDGKNHQNPCKSFRTSKDCSACCLFGQVWPHWNAKCIVCQVVLRLLYTNPFIRPQELCDSLWEATRGCRPPWMGKSFGQSFYQAGPYCIEVSNSHSNSEELSQRPNWWTKLNPTRMFGILESQNVLVCPQFIHYSPLVQSLNSTGGAPKSFGISSRSNLSWPQRKSRTDATLFSRQTGLPAEVRCLQASVVHQHHWGHPFVFILKKRPRLLAANLEPRGHRNGHHLWPWPSMTAPWQWKMHEDGRWENQKEKPCESSNQENRFFFRKNIWMRQENRRPFGT